jgi:hypothetical protein
MDVATQEHHHGDDNEGGYQPGARHNIHGKLQRVRIQPPMLGGAVRSEPRWRPYVGAIKDA